MVCNPIFEKKNVFVNNKGAHQTAEICKLICAAFIFHKQQNQLLFIPGLMCLIDIQVWPSILGCRTQNHYH